MADNEDLVDYDEDEEVADVAGDKKDGEGKDVKKGHYVGIHASGFKDF
eukprot:CAMPEP_0194045924 /NCGR_PEP_ID=MMETSP0009_2-20130614/18869_1 /TAXON_ID=210454 /ORGANISM="Grammatophora oceanica, Strain CCMP 410" /LENGTH=47 /DNA_ID= /DNA_START= /DNA_END= /DNA_ORIENTATION=